MNEWKLQAKCKDMAPETFFPMMKVPNRWSGTIAQMEKKVAREVCLAEPRCAVLADCLEAGIAMREHGVWGGTSHEERRVMIRRRERVQ